jgi:putative nucleotidyltransferase with HDIG domain
MDFTKTRDESFALLREYTQSESLLKHAFAVEAAMRFYAARAGAPSELWGQTGLLHDFDYERYPECSKTGHPFVGCQILGDHGYPDEMIEAILGHANYSGVPRRTPLAKTLFACDELCGLIMASALIRPDRAIENLTVSSIKKKFKDKAFARGVNREDITTGCAELEVPLDEHMANVLGAMQGIATELGLKP